MTKRSRVIMYKVASASEYLAITGLGIRDIKLAKKAWIFPGQSCIRFDLTPVNYTFDVMAMSVEKLPFILPTVFTIGPRADDEESLLEYTKLIISPHDQILSKELIKELVKKIVEGETRILTYSTSIEEVFRGTKEFKRELFRNVEIELNRFGLLIYNANVKHLGDVPGLDYVSYMDKMGVPEACKLLRKAVKIDDEEKVVSINDPD